MKRIKKPTLVNAREMEHQHPNTFQRDDVSEIEIGSSVKVCDQWERFWVTVVDKKGNVLTGTIDNHLLSKKLRYGDTIQFHADNVYNVL